MQAFSLFCLTLLRSEYDYGIFGREYTSLLVAILNNLLSFCLSSVCHKHALVFTHNVLMILG